MIVRAPMPRPSSARGCRNFTDRGFFLLICRALSQIKSAAAISAVVVEKPGLQLLDRVREAVAKHARMS
jgi:hypothetical protein